jgi:uncharacterized protein
MFRSSIMILFILFAYNSYAQEENPNYDKHLADSLSADDYGMKTYFFVILKTGEGNEEDAEKRQAIFRGHLDNIKELAEQGKLIVAGPLMQNDKSYRGLYIFDVKTEDELNELLDLDPAIKNNLLEPEVYTWYGSAALPVYMETAKKISKTSP